MSAPILPELAPMRVLLVEDNPGDAALLREALKEAKAPMALAYAQRLDEAVARLHEGGIDAVLLDLALPDSTGVDTVRALHEAAPDVPIVVLTGLDDEALGVSAVHYGAQDYLVKGAVTGPLLVRTLRYASERQRERQALSHAREDFRRVIEEAPAGVIILADGRCVFANRAFASYLGFDEARELVGRTAVSLAHPDERAAIASESLSLSRETRFVRKDGAVVTLELVPGRNIEFEGAPSLLLMARDVTERKRMEARLLVADRLASVGTLAAGVGHEINNPLTYAIGSLQLADAELGKIAPDERTAKVHTLLAKALVGTERVRVVVRDLTAFSRADPERRGPIDVRQALKSSVSMMHNEIRHRARLVEQLAPVPPVHANEAELGQLFLDLLVHATRAIPVGAADQHELRVSLRTSRAGDVVVEISNTGPGLPREAVDHVFDPFFAADPTGAGAGLGLSICHSIVTALGGQIMVESEPERGTLFRIVLPALRAAVGKEPTPAPAPPPAKRRARVLVVDDDPDVAEILRMMLEDRHDVVVVVCGREAISRIVAGGQFDVILCDLMMPLMTGMELHAALGELAPEQQARMVFITGGAFTPRARDFLRQSSLPCLEKPVEAPRLFALIDAAVAQPPSVAP